HIEHTQDQWALGTRAHLAGDASTLAHVLITGAPEDGHRQEGVLRSVRECDEAEAFRRIEPLHFALGAAAGLGLVIPEKSGAAIVHGASENGLRTVEHNANLIQGASVATG